MNSRVTTILLALVILPSALSAQWTWLNPLPEGNSFYDADFIGSDDGWLVGSNGSVMRTRNGGQNWESLGSVWRNTSQISLSVVFRDVSVGLISANNASLLRTTDGGLNWTPLPRSGLDIHRLRKAPDGSVWGVGSLGIIARSTDMGLHWQAFDTGTKTVIYDIDFPTSSHAVAVCGGGVVLNSTDGGTSWSQSTPSLTTDIISIDFTSPTHGFAVQQPKYLLSTTDGGQTWRDTSFTVNNLLRVRFVNQQRGWLVSNTRGKVMRTTDGGRSWEEFIADKSQQYTFFNIFPKDEYNALLFGEAGGIFLTGNTGESWTQSGRAFSRAHFTSTTALSDSAAWLFGIGAAYYTSDAGASWTGADTIGTNGIRFGYAISGTRIIGGGSQGQMLLSTDAGTTWSSQTLSGRGQINGIAFVDASTGWVAGAHGTLARSVDGGSSWNELNAGVTHDFNGLAAVDGDEAWVVGNGGKIFHTMNAGTTWSEIPCPVSADLYCIEFLSPTHGLIGGQGALLESTDGGSTWIERQLPSGFDRIRRMAFSDGLNGAFMLDQAVVRTRDGGQTFYRYDYPSTNMLDLQMTASGHIWLAGNFGTAMRYTPAAAIILRPQALNFGDVPVNKSRELPFTLENSGEADLVISNVATIGGGYLFAGGSLDPLPPTAIRTLRVAFAPPDTGMSFGVASIYSNAVQGIPHIDLTGHGIPAGTTALIHTPDTVNFGTLRLGKSAKATVFITNRVDQHLLINRETMRGGDSLVFKVTRESAFFIASGRSDSIELQFTPLEPGAFMSWLVIESNDPVEPAYAIPVIGRAATPVIATDSMIVHFAYVYIGSQSERDISIRNDGDAVLQVSGIDLRGQHAAEFSYTGGKTSIDPQRNMLLKVRFTPQTLGSKTAQLVVLSDDLLNPEFIIELRANATTTGVDDTPQPLQVELDQNYPNPYSSSSGPLAYGFSLTRPADVSIVLFDETGREAAHIAARYYTAGMHQFRIEAGELAAGLYIAELRALFADGKQAVSRVKTIIRR